MTIIHTQHAAIYCIKYQFGERMGSLDTEIPIIFFHEAHKIDESDKSFSDQRLSPWPLFETEAREISRMSYSIASNQLNHAERRRIEKWGRKVNRERGKGNMRKVSCKAKPHDCGKLPLVILDKKVGRFVYSCGANIFYLNLVQVKIVLMKFVFVR